MSFQGEHRQPNAFRAGRVVVREQVGDHRGRADGDGRRRGPGVGGRGGPGDTTDGLRGEPPGGAGTLA